MGVFKLSVYVIVFKNFVLNGIIFIKHLKVLGKGNIIYFNKIYE